VEGNQGTGRGAEPSDEEPTGPTPAAEGGGDAKSAAARKTRGRRPRRPRVRPPTQQELDDLPVDKRLELLNQHRQSRHQSLNSLGILFGVVFTAASLIATALTLRTGQEELRNAQQGQVTDRYTKATEQLGSDKPEVRLGGIYALERLMTDSARDHRTIVEVLTSFVRMHAQDPPPVGSDAGNLAADVQAALTVIGRRDESRENNSLRLDLAGVDFHGKNLGHANLARADLTFARLEIADLSRADLTGALLENARLDSAHLPHDLAGTFLRDADLVGVDLRGADLRGAELTGAVVEGADLRGAQLAAATLRNAHLKGVDLSNADLRGADLKGADLRGADLRRVRGIAAEAIRRTAKTDAQTRY
jgi:uncharacterized protein YjbI with pentapeptide repeats